MPMPAQPPTPPSQPPNLIPELHTPPSPSPTLLPLPSRASHLLHLPRAGVLPPAHLPLDELFPLYPPVLPV